ncbi:MAG: hypothetical protein WAO00_02185, partial [Chthoniobacterales bacterium]
MKAFLSLKTLESSLLAFFVLSLFHVIGTASQTTADQNSGLVQRWIAPKMAPSTTTILWYQLGSGSSFGSNSQNYEPANDPFDDELADDFVVPAGETWTIQQISLEGHYSSGNTGPATSVNVIFYSDSGTLPGVAVPGGTFTNVAMTDTSGNFIIDLPSSMVLTAGAYWVSVQANMNLATAGRWYWTDSQFSIRAGAAWRNPGGGFGNACTSWGRRATCFSTPDPDQSFALSGTTTGGPTPTATPTPSPSPTASPTPTPSAFNPNNILVAIGQSGAPTNWIREFTPAGGFVQTIPITYNGGAYPPTEKLRDIVV